MLWLGIGWIGVGLGVIGLALPVVPTVPFLLVAAWAFSRSSPRLREKIRNHPKYGPAVRAWQERGAVSRLAKLWAVSAMSFGVGLSWWLGIDPRLVLAQAVICTSIAAYVVTRPTV
ncbi:YbaN family protein [uncultured Paracoccus sp.]|uniref:YbaN family protein n=1 Tax=uncultured Paracoccus sp. TaxID=189685 RepID=UPI002618594A|nr:YbaN family protein [uncultured Paracoccus sp.]